MKRWLFVIVLSICFSASFALMLRTQFFRDAVVVFKKMLWVDTTVEGRDFSAEEKDNVYVQKQARQKAMILDAEQKRREDGEKRRQQVEDQQQRVRDQIERMQERARRNRD